MIPKKLFWMLGYNNLSIILEQERRHWLMKTDKNKQIQDSLTGDIFQGQLDNIGSDIIIESKKLPYKYDFAPEINFDLINARRILKVCNSSFPHSAQVNGLMFARIISTNYQTTVDGEIQKNHYKIKFSNASTCIIPFGASTSSDEVYAGKWIKTSTPPKMMIIDNNSERYTTQFELLFTDNVTNVTWYYPLTETLQPLEVDDLGYGNYELQAVNDDKFIGYPLFWFTCDQSNVGSNITFENNSNSRNEQIFFISNQGNASPFNAKIYSGIDGTCDATPDGTETLNYVIQCSCLEGTSFSNSIDDFNKELNKSIRVINKTTQTDYTINIICNDNDTIKMTKDIPWTYVDEHTYEIEMEYFDQNCLNLDTSTPLVSIFDVHFDESIPFVKPSSDVGIAGIRMGSANLASDKYKKYPYNLNKWNGLPTWMNNLTDNDIPEHLVMYAFHQPPTYDESDPETMQGAGLIIDPGKHKTEDDALDVDDEPVIDTDNIGRVYVLSNDEIEYVNNAQTDYPKPPRTAARICDIPTSVTQLIDVKGILEFPIVDEKYTRTEAKFSTEDKNRLWNTMASRWVRPAALNNDGVSIRDAYGYDGRFAFEMIYDGDQTINTLLDVDLIHHNDFRILENLNPMVDTSKIAVRQIIDGGEGYNVGDLGICVVGGYSFTYNVISVSDGVVQEIQLYPDSRSDYISLSNFNLDEGVAGVSDPYGTSPVTGNGRGLKFSFRILYDYYQTILPKKGELLSGLFALVRERDGVYVYNYVVDPESEKFPKQGEWIKDICVSEYDTTNINKKIGGVSTQESYINSIIPSIRSLPVSLREDNLEPVTLMTLQTSSFVHVIDKEYTPVIPSRTSEEDPTVDDNVVDICKFYCDGLHHVRAKERSINGIKEAINKFNDIRFDSYIIWKWDIDDNEEGDNVAFTYGVIYRSFNNLLTTDSITMLPPNELTCDNYVHSNSNTTVVWDVNGVGAMLWVYDPTYTKKEKYYIDQETMDLHITRESIDYNSIDIRFGEGDQPIKLVDDNGLFIYNVMTNNPIVVGDSESTSPIYQQPEMIQLEDIMVGKPIMSATHTNIFCGNWRLVLPRVNSFRLLNDETHTQWVPKKMQVIKGRNVGNVGAVYDSDGNDVSTKSLIIDETRNSIKLRLFNSTTKQWEEI